MDVFRKGFQILMISRSRMVRYSYKQVGQLSHFTANIDVASGIETVAAREVPDIVLIDTLSMAQGEVKETQSFYKDFPVFLLTDKVNETCCGVVGCLSCDLSAFEIVEILKEYFLQDKKQNGFLELEAAEKILLECLLEGESDKEIARDFGLGLSTVKYKLRKLYSKLNVRNRTQAALIASKSVV